MKKPIPLNKIKLTRAEKKAGLTQAEKRRREARRRRLEHVDPNLAVRYGLKLDVDGDHRRAGRWVEEMTRKGWPDDGSWR